MASRVAAGNADRAGLGPAAAPVQVRAGGDRAFVPGLTAAMPGRAGPIARSGPAGDGLPMGGGNASSWSRTRREIRQIVIEALEGLGYRVLAAANAAEAGDILAVHSEVDLLFTDIVMPGGKDGMDLAREARRKRPELRVLFTSGYAGRGPTGSTWPHDMPLLQKPYRLSMLARAIRDCIEEPAPRPS